MWIEAGLDPASFYIYTFREVGEIVAAKAKRDSDIFRRDAEMQNFLLHRLAFKVGRAYHAPKDFPDYEPLDFGGNSVEEKTEPTQADTVALKSFFRLQAKRSQ